MCTTPKYHSAVNLFSINKSASEAKKKCSGKCKECRKAEAINSRVASLLKISAAILVFTSISSTGFAQAAERATQPSFGDDPFNSPMLPFVIVTALIFIAVILVAVVGIYLVKILNILASQAEKEKAERLGITITHKSSWWSRFVDSMNAAVPVTQEKEIELDHNYDGIKELDNHLPPWWSWLFIGTVIWAVVYLFVYHFSGSLPLQMKEYQTELADAEQQAIRLKASQPQAVIDENALVYAPDEAIIAKGKAVFQSNNCASCHKTDGGGNGIGPNLTDKYWLHGGDIKSVFALIKNGVVEKGMPAWGKVMSPKDVHDVAFYVMSLQGTNPPNAKAPQGELYEPTGAKPDSVKAQASLSN